MLSCLELWYGDSLFLFFLNEMFSLIILFWYGKTINDHNIYLLTNFAPRFHWHYLKQKCAKILDSQPSSNNKWNIKHKNDFSIRTSSSWNKQVQTNTHFSFIVLLEKICLKLLYNYKIKWKWPIQKQVDKSIATSLVRL